MCPVRECSLEWYGRCTIELQPARPTSTYWERTLFHHELGIRRHEPRGTMRIRSLLDEKLPRPSVEGSRRLVVLLGTDASYDMSIQLGDG